MTQDTTKTLYFITGNTNKFKEAQDILGSAITLQQLSIDLPEIQSLSSKEIIQEKLKAACLHHEGPFIVEDVSLTFETLNTLPGPLIKWFLKALGTTKLSALAQGSRATATACIGYAGNKDTIHYFEGSVQGRIVSPRGSTTFGFDPIFEPEESKKTFAEMSAEEKNTISHRRLALEQLKLFLNNN